MHVHLVHHSVVGRVVFLWGTETSSWQTTVSSDAAAVLFLFSLVTKKQRHLAYLWHFALAVKYMVKVKTQGHVQIILHTCLFVVCFVSGLFGNKPAPVSTAVLISSALLYLHPIQKHAVNGQEHKTKASELQIIKKSISVNCVAISYWCCYIMLILHKYSQQMSLSLA